MIQQFKCESVEPSNGGINRVVLTADEYRDHFSQPETILWNTLRSDFVVGRVYLVQAVPIIGARKP
jgi:hypothetical protein